MNEQPQDGVSVISEISVYQGSPGVLHFAAALGWGTLAGTLSLTVAIILITLPSTAPGLLSGIVFLGVIVGLFTLAGMVVIGLPATFILSVVEEEHQFLYAAIGAFSGFAAMMILFGRSSSPGFEELLFAGPGGLAGGASAWRWGGWREALAISRQSDPIHNHQPED
ncbi:hypothetical protein [Qipengyuania vesicularis]|uniref:hypothetical protein n=1 Tax=Qipengyuania vesicularis TaxID=2867232 RepID=UPI001C884EEC|nr:hypothetical protein [Qipengyuania vesicularis]MBX7528448.1 hypothetical protein [Qipengyuania vesicularis]